MPELHLLDPWREYNSQPSKEKLFKYFKLILVLVIFIGLFFIIPIGEVLEVIKYSNYHLLIIGIILVLPAIYLKSIRLAFLTRKQGIMISVNRVFIVNMIVKFYLLFLPGTIMGSGIRWAKISSTEKSAETIAALVFNRIIELFLIIITGSFWFLTGIGRETLDGLTVVAFWVTISATWSLFIKGSRMVAIWGENHPEIGSKYPIWQRIWGYLRKILQSMIVYEELKLRDLFYLFSVGILAYLIGLTSYIFIAYSTGISLSIIHLGWMQAVIILTSFTPISFAGGIGIRDISLILLLSLFGIDPQVALAFSLLLFGRNIFLSLIGGVLEALEFFSSKKDRN